MKKISLAFCSMVALSACETWESSDLPRDLQPAQATAPIDHTAIVVSRGEIADRSYTTLGELNVSVNKTTAIHAAPTEEMVIDKLRRDAAKLGANGVVNAKISEVHVTPFSWGTRTGTGTAVRFTQ